MEFNNASFVINEIKNSNFITYLYSTDCNSNVICESILFFLTNKKQISNIEVSSVLLEDHFKIYKKMIFSLENQGFVKDKAIDKIKKLYDLFNVSLNKDKLNEIELVKLSLIKCLISNPKIIIINNIFNSLSYKNRINIITILKKICLLNNIDIILLTNNTNDLLLSDYTYIISNYKLQIEGKSDKILEEDILLNKLNFELPLIIDLSLKLKFYDVLDDVVKDVESMVNQIWN